MPVRRGARPGREHHHTRRAHRTPVRIPDARRRLASRTSAGVVGVASKHSESSHPHPHPRSREPGTFPPPSGFSVYDGEGGAPRGRAPSGVRQGGGGAIVLALLSSGGAAVAPWHRGEASSWSPVVEERSNGRRSPSALKTLAAHQGGMTAGPHVPRPAPLTLVSLQKYTPHQVKATQPQKNAPPRRPRGHLRQPGA